MWHDATQGHTSTSVYTEITSKKDSMLCMNGSKQSPPLLK